MRHFLRSAYWWETCAAVVTAGCTLHREAHSTQKSEHHSMNDAKLSICPFKSYSMPLNSIGGIGFKKDEKNLTSKS